MRLIVALLFPAALVAQVPTLTLKPADATPREKFRGLTSVHELTDGRAVVTDPTDDRMVAINFATGAIEQIGRIESGPGAGGNFRALPMFGGAGDSSIVIDPTLPRMAFFVGTRLTQVLTAGHPLLDARTFPYGVDQRGRMLVPISPRPAAGQRLTAADSTLLTIIDLAGTSMEVAGKLAPYLSPAPDRVPAGARDIIPAYRTYDKATMSRDGWVAIVRATPYSVEWRAPDGTWTKGSVLARTIPLTADERELFIKQHSKDPEYLYPTEIPPFTASSQILATPDGKLLVRRTATVAAPYPPFDVIDRRGERVAQLVVPEGQTIIGFGARAVYVSVKDGTQARVERHPWP